jgi:uncharacterized protein YjgD (DUF1641 family)
MAEPLEYTVRPAKIGPDAHEELERLLQTLHEHGVLRFANDVVAANTQITQTLVEELNKEGMLNAIQNLSVLVMMLSSIPPNDFYKVLFAARDALVHLSDPPAEAQKAPTLRGAYEFLRDRSVWRVGMSFFGALKTFADGMSRKIDKPISAFTGKSSRS